MQHTFLQQSSRVPGLGNIPGHTHGHSLRLSTVHISPLHCCSYTAMVRRYHQPADTGRDLQIWVPNLAEHNADCQCSVLYCHMHSAIIHACSRPSKGLRHLADPINIYGFCKL